MCYDKYTERFVKWIGFKNIDVIIFAVLTGLVMWMMDEHFNKIPFLGARMSYVLYTVILFTIAYLLGYFHNSIKKGLKKTTSHN